MCRVETQRLVGAQMSTQASSYLEFQCIHDPRTQGEGKALLLLFVWSGAHCPYWA